MDLIFATNNAHKLEELKAAVPQLNLKGLKEVGILEDIPETGTTLQQNARIKARYIYDKLKVNCFADDTGLEVDHLNGEPGVYSARYAGDHCSFEDNNTKLLKALNGVSDRSARFKTMICLIIDDQEFYFEGVCEGAILDSYAGKDGFGYDPLFLPKGFNESFAQMSMNQKNEISHRGLAVKKLIEYLNRM